MSAGSAVSAADGPVHIVLTAGSGLARLAAALGNGWRLRRDATQSGFRQTALPMPFVDLLLPEQTRDHRTDTIGDLPIKHWQGGTGHPRCNSELAKSVKKRHPQLKLIPGPQHHPCGTLGQCGRRHSLQRYLFLNARFPSYCYVSLSVPGCEATVRSSSSALSSGCMPA